MQQQTHTSNESTNKNTIAQSNQQKPLINENNLNGDISHAKTTTSDLINDINNHLNITNTNHDKSSSTFQTISKPINENNNSRNLVLNNFSKINATTSNPNDMHKLQTNAIPNLNYNTSYANIMNSSENHHQHQHNFQHQFSSQKNNNIAGNHLYQNNHTNRSNGSLNAMDITSPASSVVSNENGLQSYLAQNQNLQKNSINGLSAGANFNSNQNVVFQGKHNNFYAKNNNTNSESYFLNSN